MSFIISNIVVSLLATFIAGATISWALWGRCKHKLSALNAEWTNRYSALDAEYNSVTDEFSKLESELKQQQPQLSMLNDDKTELTGKLTASKALLHEADKEIDKLKKQLGQTTAHLHVTNKELDENRQELNSIRSMPNESNELKALLGEATKRYNLSGLQLKTKQDEYTDLEGKYSAANKRIELINTELEHLRTKLLKRDNEFKNQIVLFSNLQNQHDEKNKLLISLQEELRSGNKNNDQNTEIEQRDVKIAKLNKDLNDVKDRIPALEGSLKQRDATIAALENEITRVSKEIPPMHDKLDMREKQVEDLQQQVPALKSTISARDAHIRELEILVQDAQKAIPKPVTKNGSANGNGKTNGATAAKSKTNGNGHSHANGSNGNVVHINGNGKTNGSTKNAVVTKLNGANGKAAPTKRKLKSYGLSKPSRKPDDLKLISGVGVALEKTLHKCGVFYFEQIAGFTRKDVKTVDDMLNFKGRIDRDEWIKQAKILIRGGTYERKKPESKASATSKRRRMKPIGMKRPKGELDDLQLINGVGPKLERKLHRLGVYHYEQIAEFTAEDIDLLDSKLKTYKGRVKRDKWPLQARRLHKEFYVTA